MAFDVQLAIYSATVVLNLALALAVGAPPLERRHCICKDVDTQSAQAFGKNGRQHRDHLGRNGNDRHLRRQASPFLWN